MTTAILPPVTLAPALTMEESTGGWFEAGMNSKEKGDYKSYIIYTMTITPPNPLGTPTGTFPSESCNLPNARGEERSDGRVRMMLQ